MRFALRPGCERRRAAQQRNDLAAVECFEGRSDVLGSTNFHWDVFEAKRAGRHSNLPHFQHRSRIADIAHDR